MAEMDHAASTTGTLTTRVECAWMGACVSPCAIHVIQSFCGKGWGKFFFSLSRLFVFWGVGEWGVPSCFVVVVAAAVVVVVVVVFYVDFSVSLLPSSLLSHSLLFIIIINIIVIIIFNMVNNVFTAV